MAADSKCRELGQEQKLSEISASVTVNRGYYPSGGNMGRRCTLEKMCSVLEWKKDWNWSLTFTQREPILGLFYVGQTTQ